MSSRSPYFSNQAAASFASCSCFLTLFCARQTKGRASTRAAASILMIGVISTSSTCSSFSFNMRLPYQTKGIWSIFTLIEKGGWIYIERPLRGGDTVGGGTPMTWLPLGSPLLRRWFPLDCNLLGPILSVNQLVHVSFSLNPYSCFKDTLSSHVSKCLSTTFFHFRIIPPCTWLIVGFSKKAFLVYIIVYLQKVYEPFHISKSLPHKNHRLTFTIPKHPNPSR